MSKKLFSFGEFIYRTSFPLYFILYSFYKKISDKKEMELFKKIIKPGDVILDIGANIGLYSSYFSRLCGKTGTVHSFEPDVTNFKNLKKVTSNLSNVSINHVAVSDSNKPLKIYTSHRLNVDHRTYPVDTYSTSYEVPATSIDDYVQNKYKVNIIKIDIQGAEFPALTGMTETLKANPEVIIFMEICPSALRDFGVEIKTIFDFLHSLGFFVFDYSLNKISTAATSKYAQYADDAFENVIISKEIPSGLK